MLKPRARHCDDAGFTLIELLVTMALSLIIMFATLNTFDAFTSNSDANSRLTDAQDTTRRTVDDMTRALRNATPVGIQPDAIVRPATPGATNDVIFGTYGTNGSTTPVFGRYCVNTTTRTLWYEQSPDTTSANPGTTCPSTGTWTRSALLNGSVANTATSPALSVDSLRRAIGINLLLDAGQRNGVMRTLALRSSAYLRSSSGRAPNISANDINVTCTTVNGSKQALLALGVGINGGDPLAATFAVAGVNVGSGTSVSVAANSTLNVAVTVTNLLGLKQLLTKTVTC